MMNAKEIYYKSEKFAEYLILRRYSSRSQHTIKEDVRRFAIWVDDQNIEIEQIQYNDILAYVNHCKKIGNVARTIQISLNGVKQYYNFLIHENQRTENPCTNIEIKGVKRRILYETFTPEELDIIYKTFGNINLSSGELGVQITHKRNKIILGLIIYQGLKSEELAKMKVSDVRLKEGKIIVGSGRRSNQRELSLEAHQLYDLIDYINETRKILLSLTGKNTDQLFLSKGTGVHFHNMISKLSKKLQKQDSRIKSLQQLRTSVITNWLKTDNIRKVQYKAGHRYVSSTEGYQLHDMDNLKDEISKYHPDI